MLDIQVDGDVFAAPNGGARVRGHAAGRQGPRRAAAHAELRGRPAGGQAGDEAGEEGRHERAPGGDGRGDQVRPRRARTTSRGLAGCVPLYHIAAAAAAEGKSLDEVADIAQRYADNMASITVKCTDATHPQNGMSLRRPGRDGPDGDRRRPARRGRRRARAHGLVQGDRRSWSRPSWWRAVGLEKGDKAFVMINGCGATTMMEMLILYKDAVRIPGGPGRRGRGQHGGGDPHRAGGRRLPDRTSPSGTTSSRACGTRPAHTPVFFKE